MTRWLHGEFWDLIPNELLRWGITLWAKPARFHWYDFVGADRDLAQKISRAQQLSASDLTGPTWFKFGFGGRHLELPPDLCYFPNPLARGIMRRWGERILRNHWIQRHIQQLNGCPSTKNRSLPYFPSGIRSVIVAMGCPLTFHVLSRCFDPDQWKPKFTTPEIANVLGHNALGHSSDA